MDSFRLSIDNVLHNSRYKKVEDRPIGGYPQCYQITVEDIVENVYWCAVYMVSDDASDIFMPVTWLRAKKVAREQYEPVRGDT